jgi:hypothetical protein
LISGGRIIRPFLFTNPNYQLPNYLITLYIV